MARQSTSPVEFNRSVRTDQSVLMSSARAGVVAPVGFIPLLPGDSAAGKIGIDLQLKEMPKPLLNAVHANFQAWFVPKSAHPQFAGLDELYHSMTGEKIKALGSPDRDPPPYFQNVEGGGHANLRASKLFRTLGLHIAANSPINADLVDAFNLVYNFRLAAHSSRIQRRKYASEDIVAAASLPPAFWPSNRFGRVVPDYERALVVGALDLDVIAGRLPISGFGVNPNTGPTTTNHTVVETGGKSVTYPAARDFGATGIHNLVRLTADKAPDLWAELAGQRMSITLDDIKSAETARAFAKLRTAYAGNDTTGYDNDDTIVSLLMQGINVDQSHINRPWLLDSAIVPVGFAERFATDAANLDQSVTIGRASARLALNVPRQDTGGIIIVTCEVLPERVDERMSDEWLHCRKFDDLPNALRDIQRVEPVDLVLNRRRDAAHVQPVGLYGYEPMNDKWNRDYTRLGGLFYQAAPGSGWTENRANIWQSEIVNPALNWMHYLAPQPFPHDVFSDQDADAFEFVARHSVKIVGLTQFGDVLAENNDDYDAVKSAGEV